MSRALQYAASAAIGLTLWAIASHWFDITTFPGPVETLHEFVRLLGNGTLVWNSAVSAFRIVTGFLIGCAIGAPIGLLMGVSEWWRRALEPFTEFLRFVPAISMIVFAIIWFGVGEASKIFLIIFNTVFLVIVSTEAGVQAVNRNAVRAAAMLGASPTQQFFYVVVPATIPFMLTGMRLAMSRSFTTIAAAEMVGASAGIGSMIFGARQFGRMDTVLVGILALAIIGLTVDVIFRWLVRRYSGELSGSVMR